ncbi:hypothetical protein GGQ20_001490 [Salinibacter ruber]|uniref:hypothetical protein n=1 Tax=Salinibacter ruber TaxID=146919 RepID=UPI00216764F1|nr:hypothetical protein [Salinibacter ruber]MCS3700181.1 hypothetical protein [Salinibacter ruber]
MVLILGSLLGPRCARAQSTETQQLSLEQGENFVSLRVQPEDASLSTIFQGHLGQIHRVKDELGRVYMPGIGIKQFTTWDPNESYKVYTESAFDMEVTGTPLSLTTATVPLEKGGNLIPFVPADPQAVDDALASVSGTLARVEDEDDQIYEPGGASSSLDSLRAGQGYVLYVDQPDTLTYTIQTATLMEALSLQGVQAGQYIRARGRDEPGDGGGGIFEVTESDRGMDGGIVFAFDEDLKAQTETITGGIRGVSLSNTDIKWGSLNVRYGSGSEDVISDLHLHGLRKNRGGYWRFFDHQNGSFVDTGWLYLNELESGVGWDRGGEYEVSYKYATSDRRLERQNVGSSVQLEWWGPPTLDPNNVQYAGAHLIWAMDVASRIYGNNSYDEVNVEIESDYYVLNQIQILDGVVLQGVGPLNEDGSTRAELRVPPGEALYQWRKDLKGGDGRYDFTKDPNRERVHSHFRGPKQNIEILNGADATSPIGLRQILYNGNLPNNTAVFDTNDYSHPNISIGRWLQDAGDWQGFYGKEKVDGKPIILNDYHVRNGGGSGVGYAATFAETPDFKVDGLKIHTTERNHLLYNIPTAPGEWAENIHLSGSFWGGSPFAQTGGDFRFRSVTIENIVPGRYNYNTIVGLRRGGAKLHDFTIDLRGSVGSAQAVGVLVVDGPNLDVQNWTVHGYYSGDYNFDTIKLFQQRQYKTGDSWHDAQVGEPSLFKNITAINEGIPIRLFGDGTQYLDKATFEDITLDVAQGVSEDMQKPPVQLKVYNGTPVSLDRARRIDFKNVEIHEKGVGGNGSISAKNTGGTPLDVYWSGGLVNNSGELYSRKNIDAPNWRKIGFFMDGVEINIGGANKDGLIGTFSPPGELSNPNETNRWVRLRNVTDGNGLFSEDSGTYTSDGSDEGGNTVLFQTSLFSYPWETVASVTSPNDVSVSSIQVSNSDGTKRTATTDFKEQREPYLKVTLDRNIQSGETVEIDWTARVTASEDYQTTGLFVAREVRDKTYTSGSGPFTVDLRGTSSSQESHDPVVYTASSGDTSVVTANAQADDYTLELTEQGTGTATIAVTGEIVGVGTTTATFEVTVE